MSGDPDFEAEGLLEGVSGEAREARVQLLAELFDRGADLEELQQAVAEGRLALVGVELALAGRQRYTSDDVAERSGVERELLESQWRALGMVVGDGDEETFSSDDLKAAERVRAFLDAGIDPDGMLEVARVMAMSMSQVAAANRQLVGELFARGGPGGGDQGGEDAAGLATGGDELEQAHRFEALAGALVPMVAPALEHIYKLQLREQIRHAAIDEGFLGAEGDAVGELMAIAFADLVGFTRLGEQLPPEEFGSISTRFGELASDAAHGPVRLVKLIGDAVMLASSDPAALAGATLDLIDLVAEEGEGFPAVRAGMSLGRVLPRGGDFYGRPVNLASRLTGVARPDSLLLSADARERLDGEFRFSDAGSTKLKGIDGPVKIFRCRDLDDDSEGDGDEDGGSGDSDESDGSSRKRRRRRRRRR